MTATINRDTLQEPTVTKPPAPEQTHTIGRLTMLHRSGESIAWDTRDEASVCAAHALFNSLMNTGCLAFTADDPTGRTGEQIKTFDPQAETIMVTSPFQGG